MEGMKSAKQIFENEKTKNEDNHSHNLTSIHHQLRKTLLRLSTKTVLRCSDIEQCRINHNSLVDRALLLGISIKIMKV